jgi:hypothetical protein
MNLTKMRAQHERTEQARERRKPTRVEFVVPGSMLADLGAMQAMTAEYRQRLQRGERIEVTVIDNYQGDAKLVRMTSA